MQVAGIFIVMIIFMLPVVFHLVLRILMSISQNISSFLTGEYLEHRTHKNIEMALQNQTPADHCL